jgi:uncharacterized membrane protein
MTPTGVEEAKETVEEAGEGVAESATDAVPDGGGDSLAKRVLIPAAAGVGTLAATMAARNAPDLFRNHVLPKLEQQGGEVAANTGKQAASRLAGEGGVLGSVAGKAAEKLGRGGGKKKTRRLPIQRWTDVAVPVEVAYERWTNFEDFPKFMHRVLSVEEKDSDHVTWQEKIWFSKRQWEGEITQQEKNDRIAWTTVSGTSHSGLVTFHALDDKLTRVMVTIDFQPRGIIEKMASGLRFAKRAVEADLARFKAYVEMEEAEGLEYSPEGGQNQRSKGGKDDDGDSSGENGAGNTEAARRRTSDETERARKERAQRREQRH